MNSETPITPERAVALNGLLIENCGPVAAGLTPPALPLYSGHGIAPQTLRQLRLSDRYRNNPCACGSGKKFKKCCGKP